MLKNNKHKLVHAGVGLRGGLMILLASIMVLPFGGNAFAADAGSPAELYNGAKTVLHTTSLKQSQISLSIGAETEGGGSPTLDASDDANAAKYYYRTVTANVKDAGSYSVSVQGASANLTSGSNTIPSTTTQTTLANMAANHWGYSAGDNTPGGSTVFGAIPTGAAEVAYTRSDSNAITENKRIYLAFGAKVDANQPAGTYTNRVTVSAVAQPGQVATFDGITTMQAMNSSICKKARTNDTARLQDTRDGRYYWVTKLADGNCWMSQNLQLDLSTGTALNNVTSDLGNADPNGNPVENEWTPGYSTTSELKPFSSTQWRSQRSWTQGLYVLNTPTLGINCGNDQAGQGLNTQGCINAGFVNVGSGWADDGKTTTGANGVTFVASDDPNFFANNGGYAIAVKKDASGKMITESKTMNVVTGTDASGNITTADVAVNYPVFETNADGKVEFDAHYLVGNWYQWNAAIAGGDGPNPAEGAEDTTGKLNNGMSAPNSICPKNWKLPTSGPDNEVSGSFAYLLKAYGVNSQVVTPNTDGAFNSFDGKQYDIAQNPLFFVRSGHTHYDGRTEWSGIDGYDWSSRAYTNAGFQGSFGLYFNASGVYPSGNYDRFWGFPLRCLVR